MIIDKEDNPFCIDAGVYGRIDDEYLNGECN